MRATPLQIVKDKHGSKTDLIDKIVGLVGGLPDESADEHKRRLRNVSNAKLLHLLEVGQKVEQMGGKDAVVKQVLELKGQAKDHEYSDKLKQLSLPRLVDLLGGLKRAAKKAPAKKAPAKKAPAKKA